MAKTIDIVVPDLGDFENVEVIEVLVGAGDKVEREDGLVTVYTGIPDMGQGTHTTMAMIAAEEMGITSKNVDAMLKSKDPKIKRFLGVSPGNGKALGLDENWAYKIIKFVGNYGEVFERNIGVNTPLKIERGLNAQWTNGGLMYAPPFK